jgi:uncharacterized membrane protein YphA (DoxX/SURF4 family)
MLPNQLNKSYWILRVVFGAVPIVAGLDKFTNLLTNWEQYLSPMVGRMIAPNTFMHLVGVIEIAAGIIVLSKFTRWGAYIVTAWLVGIALNILATGHFLDVAVRDLAMACGAFALAQMEEVRGHQRTSVQVTAGNPRPAHA